MLRTILVLLALVARPVQLCAEEPAQGGWQVTVTPQARPPQDRIRKPQCPFGVGVCGGKCAEDGRKQWDCAEGELPCYQEGRCSCQAADICKPKKKKKSTLGNPPALSSRAALLATPGANSAAR